MGAVVVVVLGGSLVIGSMVLLRRRATRNAVKSLDAPAVLLAWAVGFFAVDRAEWGQAMVGELEQIERLSQRWRFALGCLSAALRVPPRPEDSGRLVVGLVVATAIGSVAVVVYGVLRYPGMLDGGGAWLVLATFIAVLACLTLMTAITVRRGAAGGVGLAGGVAVAVVWIVVGLVVVAAASSQPAFSLLLVALPLVSLAVGAAGAWRGKSATAGRKTALVSAVVAGLLLFLALASTALITAGGPYDAGQIRDFPSSGLPNMATYAVSDNLGTAMVLLLLASTMTATIGSLGAAITARIGGTPPSHTGDPRRGP